MKIYLIIVTTTTLLLAVLPTILTTIFSFMFAIGFWLTGDGFLLVTQYDETLLRFTIIFTIFGFIWGNVLYIQAALNNTGERV